jgi:hypothetical protein
VQADQTSHSQRKFPAFEGCVPFSDKEKTGRQVVPFFKSAAFL